MFLDRSGFDSSVEFGAAQRAFLQIISEQNRIGDFIDSSDVVAMDISPIALRVQLPVKCSESDYARSSN
jgi:hypothetical protein